MKYRKLVAIATLSLMMGGLVGALTADPADARAGRRGGSFGGSSSYKSMGDRGNRTFDQGQQKNMQGITQSRQTTAKPAAAAGAAQKQSWFQRNPLMAGLVGALAGTAIGAMLFNMLGGMGGLGGMMGILGLLLLAGLAFMAFRMFRASRQPQFSGMGANGNVTPFQRPDAPMAYSATQTAPGQQTGASGYQQTKDQGLAAIALANPSFRTEKAVDELTTVFFRVQEAWSANDKAGIQAVTTPEMADYFGQDLDLMVMKGERNIIKNIVIRQFEITEAWQEEQTEFITAKIQARLVDYVERNGQVVEGDAHQPTDFAEFWTFTRPRGGDVWKLSAVNQIS
ncbi:Tim44-like domain protein [compost metagenome]